MDKFGIFKLLGSFMDFYTKNKNSAFSGEETPAQNGEKGINTLGDVLSAVIGKSKNADAGFSAKPNPRDLPKPPRAPLQNSMLYVMKRHDDIVNRIKRK